MIYVRGQQGVVEVRRVISGISGVCYQRLRSAGGTKGMGWGEGNVGQVIGSIFETTARVGRGREI